MWPDATANEISRAKRLRPLLLPPPVLLIFIVNSRGFHVKFSLCIDIILFADGAPIGAGAICSSKRRIRFGLLYVPRLRNCGLWPCPAGIRG